MSTDRYTSFPPRGLRVSALAGLLAALLAPAPALATPTGLNNIPTADTPSDLELVFQAFTNLGGEGGTDYVVGFKMGLQPLGQHLELGADGRIGEGEAGPLLLQFKYALPLGEKLPTVAAGIANLALTSDDRERAGEPAPYVVLTQDLDWFRVTGGYLFQSYNYAAFFGFDKTFEVFDRDFQLRSDFIQIDNQDQWLGSLGFIYFVDEHLAFESWVSVPLDHGRPIFTLKLDLIFTF